MPPANRIVVVVCASVLFGVAVLPAALGWSSGANAWVLAIGLAIGMLLTRAQPHEWRVPFRNIFLLGLTVRVVAHIAVFAWASASGGPFLSPDATLYFRESLHLAMVNLRLPVAAYVFFGTFDCAHYYLFGAVRWLFGAGLFDLQTVNIILASLAGPLTYAIARRLHVPYALPVGVVVAVYPSLVALSVNDLMKDASVIGLFMVGAWAVIEMWSAPARWGRRLALVMVAVAALSYVRMSRFYVPAFFEAAILTALGLALAKQRLGSGSSGASRAAVVSLLATVGLAEALPMWLGWGSSPVMVWQVLNHSLETPEMRFSAVGMVDRIQAGGQVGPRHSGDLSATGNVSSRASDVVVEVNRTAGHRRSTAIVPPPPESLAEVPLKGPPPPPPTISQRVTRVAANGVRKLFGPFPWVMPPSWDARTILVGDYLMFPGMILWYLLLPVALAGLVLVPWTALRQSPFAYPLLALTIFVGILFAQYLVLNLSYRQREFMFPILALDSAFAISHRPASRWSALVYTFYLGGLVALAVVHLALRSDLI